MIFEVGLPFVPHGTGIVYPKNERKLIPPGSLTYSLKIYHPKRKVVFQPSIFRGYVKLREGTGCGTHFQLP